MSWTAQKKTLVRTRVPSKYWAELNDARRSCRRHQSKVHRAHDHPVRRQRSRQPTHLVKLCVAVAPCLHVFEILFFEGCRVTVAWSSPKALVPLAVERQCEKILNENRTSSYATPQRTPHQFRTWTRPVGVSCDGDEMTMCQRLDKFSHNFNHNKNQTYQPPYSEAFIAFHWRGMPHALPAHARLRLSSEHVEHSKTMAHVASQIEHFPLWVCGWLCASHMGHSRCLSGRPGFFTSLNLHPCVVSLWWLPLQHVVAVRTSHWRSTYT